MRDEVAIQNYNCHLNSLTPQLQSQKDIELLFLSTYIALSTQIPNFLSVYTDSRPLCLASG